MKRISIFCLFLAGCQVELEQPTPAHPHTAVAEALQPPWIWISPQEIQALPTSGPAYAAVKSWADQPVSDPSLADQDDPDNIRTFAKALLCVRQGAHCNEVRSACMAIIGTESDSLSRGLSVGRELMAYVVAAQLVGLSAADDARFRSWLGGLRTRILPDGRTLVSTHEDRANNWGTHAGASRIAADIYLGDSVDLQRAAQVFRGWLGDRSAYSGFAYGDACWQTHPGAPVGVNPMNTVLPGFGNADGALPDDMRRGCCPQLPPCHTDYVWEALQGVIAQAWMLSRQGDPAFAWEDQAVLRAVQFVARLDRDYGNWWAGGDDTWIPWLVNRAYRTSFRTTSPSSPGKNIGFTDWTQTRSTTDVFQP